jgi:quercetin dioxygenase-like cupin family protein
MKRFYQFTIFILWFLVIAFEGKSQISTVTQQNEETAFPKGEKINSSNFTGTAYLYMMVTIDSVYQTTMGNVTFEPKARTNWHKHPAGQILLVTDGKGYYQEKGKPARHIQKGDVVKIPPDAEHWHGAAPDRGLSHIAINPNIDKGSVVWFGPVTVEEYEKLNKKE